MDQVHNRICKTKVTNNLISLNFRKRKKRTQCQCFEEILFSKEERTQNFEVDGNYVYSNV